MIYGNPIIEVHGNQYFFIVPNHDVRIRANFEPFNFPIILTTNIPDGIVGEAYNYQIQAIHLPNEFHWEIWPSEDSLPNGLSFEQYTGVIYGTPTEAGHFNFFVALLTRDWIIITPTLSISIEYSETESDEPTTDDNPRSNLSTLIAYANSRIQSDYTPLSWAMMQSSLRTALSIYNNPTSSEIQINNAINILTTALNNLIPR